MSRGARAQAAAVDRDSLGGDHDRGASLVEFALVLPFLLLLILGMVELSIVFAQYNEIRHGAREGARYAAVSRPDYDGAGGTGDFADVLAVTCDKVNLPNVGMTVSLASNETDGDGVPERLEYATLTVTASTSSLTRLPLVSFLVPASLTNTATFRLEQDGAWSPTGATPCP